MASSPTYLMFVGGEYVPAASGKTFPVENPATEEVIAEVSEGDAIDVDRAVAAAARAFERWGSTSGAARARVLNRVGVLLAERLPDLVSVEVDQTGRPLREMKAQLARLPEWYEYFAAVARTDEASVPPFGGPYLNYTRRVPLGVVGQLTPWNHPLLILTKKVAPALAAGNTLVVKPSELAPLTPLMLGDILQAAGLPEGAYNVVPGFGATAGLALASHPGIAKIDLTGGTETGKAVASIAGKNLTRVAAELGGKAPVIVFDDVDLERAVSGTLFASFIAAGQTCVQGALLLAHRSIHDAFVERLVERANKIVIGNPRDLKTEMGPLVSTRQLETVERYVALGREAGARVVAGGRRPTGPGFERGYFYTPTVFTEVTIDMRVAQEEIFGPVVCVLPFETEEEAIRLANGTPFGLAGSIWTRDVRRAHRLVQRLKIGIIWINDHHRIDPASPWGGFKESGIGRENGLVAYHDYTQLQSIIVNLSEEPLDWYGGEAEGKRYS
ncbi:MAG: aldehyde dehydrogenase [Kiloniellaceae bacterium]